MDYIEEYKTVNKTNYYGTNNIDLVKCLIRDGYNPVKTIIENDEPVHYFKRTKNFDYDMLFHKGMIEGWLSYVMLELFDKYDEGPGSFDGITE